MKRLLLALLASVLLFAVTPTVATAASSTAPFGVFPGTDHALCPPSSGYKWPPPPAYGEWSNSQNFDNYDGVAYGCRAQQSDSGAAPTTDTGSSDAGNDSSTAPFGLFPGTNHALCPPSSGYKSPPAPAYGDWTNSRNFNNYEGADYGCRAQQPDSGDAPGGNSGTNETDVESNEIAQAATPAQLSRPSLISVEASPRYVSVIWRKSTKAHGYNVYRNDEFVASVGSAGNVYSDFSGKEGDRYHVIAYDGNGGFSERSLERSALCDRECQDATQLTLLGSSSGTRAVITWADNKEANGRYTIYRDGVVVARGTDLTHYEDRAPGQRRHTYRVTVEMPALDVRSAEVSLEPNGDVVLATLAPTATDNNKTSAGQTKAVRTSVKAVAVVVVVGGVAVGVARRGDLREIDRGEVTPDPDSRLGAYGATAGYPEGTVGYGAHRAIGSLYTLMGDLGEEEIGTFFNSPEAQALLSQPVTSAANRRLAELELEYWESQQGTLGGFLGTKFGVGIRSFIQGFFGGDAPSDDAPSTPSAGDYGDSPLHPANVVGDPLLDPDNDGLSVFSDIDNDGDGVPTWEDRDDLDPSVGRPTSSRPSNNGGGSDNLSSDRDEEERNEAGHEDPGSDAGTEELSGYAG